MNFIVSFFCQICSILVRSTLKKNSSFRLLKCRHKCRHRRNCRPLSGVKGLFLVTRESPLNVLMSKVNLFEYNAEKNTKYWYCIICNL